MPLNPQLRAQLLNSFRAELSDHVQTLTDGLLALEQRSVSVSQHDAALEELFRAAHNLKGAARAVGVTLIEQLGHALEDILELIQSERVELTTPVFTLCFQTLDAIQMAQAASELDTTRPPLQAAQVLADVEAFRGRYRPAVFPNMPDVVANLSPEVEEPVLLVDDLVSSAEHGGETIRVSAAKLDALYEQMSELLIARIRIEQGQVQMREIQTLMGRWQSDLRPVRSAGSHLAQRYKELNGEALVTDEHSAERKIRLWSQDVERVMEFVAINHDHMQELNAKINSVTRAQAKDMLNLSVAIDALEQEIKQTRMLPLSSITAPFGRMVRDLALSSGKEAVLEVEGGDTELDRWVLEQIKDPLLHLLRNAIDHGLEFPAQRIAARKSLAGTITIQAQQRGQEVWLSVADDGAGLDVDAIRRTLAQHSGTHVESMSEQELSESIFQSGVSTRSQVTAVSGRGIGLDVVRQNVRALNGRVRVDWRVGAGTTFTIILPLTMMHSRGLLVHVSDQLFALPLTTVERILVVRPPQLLQLDGYSAIEYDDVVYALHRLSEVLDLPRAQVREDEFFVLIVTAAERRMAFVVDGVSDEQEMVVRGLRQPLARVAGIAGAAVIGNGDVVLVLDVNDLIQAVSKKQHGTLLILPEVAVSS